MGKKYEHLIVNKMHWVQSLTDHEGSIGDKGFPVLMSSDLVPKAKTWVCPAMLTVTEGVLAAARSGALGKATRHIHDDDEMYLILGEEKAVTIAVTLGEDHYEVQPPAAVYIPAGLPHSIEMAGGEAGKFGGACPVYLGKHYITLPVPETPLRLESTEHLIVRGMHWTKELPDHEGAVGEKGFPVLMSSDIVPEAKAWVCPALLTITEEILGALASGKLGKANPHIHDGDEMYLILGEDNAATIAVTLGDESYEVNTPAAVYIPAGVPHSIRMAKGTLGKYGGACPVYFGTEYITKPVPSES